MSNEILIEALEKIVEELHEKELTGTIYQCAKQALENYSLAQQKRDEDVRVKMVLGFMFNEAETVVLLIEKLKPDWQKHKLNGIGGKVENGESFKDAMIREFKEETGIEYADWQEVILMYGEDWEVQVFTATTDIVFYHKQVEEEKLRCLHISNELSMYRTISNLKWLIPLCLDKNDGTGIIDYSLSKNEGYKAALQSGWSEQKKEIIQKIKEQWIEDYRDLQKERESLIDGYFVSGFVSTVLDKMELDNAAQCKGGLVSDEEIEKMAKKEFPYVLGVSHPYYEQSKNIIDSTRHAFIKGYKAALQSNQYKGCNDELTAANKRIEELEEEARQGRVSESQLIIAEKRISELENEVQRLKQSNPVNDWIKPEIDLPDENRKILFFPTTEAVKNYKSYHLRLGSFLKKDQWGRENMFCDGSFFPASAVDVWMYAPTPPQTK